MMENHGQKRKGTSATTVGVARMDRFSAPDAREATYVRNLAEASRCEPRGTIIRVVCERGIDFMRNANGAWHFATQNESTTTSPIRMYRDAGLRPIAVFTTRTGAGLDSWILPDSNDPELTLADPLCVTKFVTQSIYNVHALMDFAYYFEHVKIAFLRVVSAYAWGLRDAFGPMQKSHNSTGLVFGATWIGFAVDEVLIALCRILDRLRFPVLQRFGVNQELPRKWGWEFLIKNMRVRDDRIISLLDRAKKRTEVCRDCRGCVVHHSPSGGTRPHAEWFRLPNTGMGLSFYLTHTMNEGREQGDCSPGQLDALSYCWTSLNDVMRVCAEILELTTSRETDLPYPDEV